MPRYIDSLFILEEPTRANEVIITLSDWFKKNNIGFSSDSNVIFNDLNELEREPEMVSLEEEAISKLISWPSLGGTEYNFSGRKMSVFFYGSRDYCVDVVAISIIATTYIVNSESQKLYDVLINKIHHLLKAKRSISDYELIPPTSFLTEEVNRVRKNIYVGRYTRDLR